MKIIPHIENARWVSHPNHAIEISGWCFCEAAFVDAFAVLLSGTETAAVAPTERPDVERHQGGNPHALRSGFKITLPLLELESSIELRAVVGATSSSPFFSARAGDLPGRGAIIVGYASWARALQAKEQLLPPDLPPVGKFAPLVSLLLPVYNTPPRFLTECVESVLGQTYPHWELLVVDDGSTSAGLRDLLASFARRDPRISVDALSENTGISRATNHALAKAGGEYVGCIDHDDRLHPQALAEVVHRLISTQAIAVYTDEEKITADGDPSIGVFKPGFSPEFLCGVMYIGHLLCVRTAVARAIGGFNPRYDGIQDFEFALRLSEHSPKIEHLPKILYQWRMSSTSSAQSGNVKGDMDRLQLEAVTEHLRRNGRQANLTALGAHRVRLLPKPAETLPRSALLVPHESFLERIQHAGSHEILVLDELTVAGLGRVLERTDCEHLLWVNESLVIEAPSAIASLLAFLDEPSVGAAAPVLLANDGKIFASGAIITPKGSLVPAMRGFSAEVDGYNGSLVCNREVSTVLAACVALRCKDLRELLSETAHPFSDAGMAGLCLALQRRNLRVLVCGALQFGLRRDWGGHGGLKAVIGLNPHWTDPYYNVHLNAEHGDYRLRSNHSAP
ncbi:MAG: glycosyltransferase [Opitutaceae bacterium]